MKNSILLHGDVWHMLHSISTSKSPFSIQTGESVVVPSEVASILQSSRFSQFFTFEADTSGTDEATEQVKHCIFFLSESIAFLIRRFTNWLQDKSAILTFKGKWYKWSFFPGEWGEVQQLEFFSQRGGGSPSGYGPGIRVLKACLKIDCDS